MSEKLHSLSVIVPFYNEEESLDKVLLELISVLENNFTQWEVIAVDDGSKDRTAALLENIAKQNPHVKVVSFVRNFGQTAAMMAGIDHASNDIIVGMDGDGQNDPSSIPDLVAKLDEGYGVVSGWRKDRKDKELSRKLPSRIANKIVSKFGGVHLNDYGCSLKAYRSEFIKPVRLYGEMHRFIPIYTSWQGGKIAEIPVKHRAREAGTSKYGINRVFKVLLDICLIRFLHDYLTKPIYVFGGVSFTCFFLAGLCAIWAIGLKLFDDTSFIQTPLPLLIVMLGVTGTLSLLMGLLAEIIVRTYHESQNLPPYQVKQYFNLAKPKDN